jgi:protein-S-isoprenylcysteine O-methyltransferase Ste14
MARLERLGAHLFTWRSFTPLLLLPVALPLLWRSREMAHPLWAIAGLVLCAAGQALRAWVLGQVPDGTSGQNEVLIATQLNTSGPYAHTRNPLYLGNLGITVGLCAVAHEPLLLALVALLFGLQYRAIIATEEAFLRGQFGAAFDDFCARVPRFWPSLSARTDTPSRPFSPKRAVWKEHNPAASWLLIAIALLASDRAVTARRAAEPLGLMPYAIAAAVVLAAYLGIKAWKHHWFSGGFWADMRRRVRETAR